LGELAMLEKQCVVGSFSQVWLFGYIILAIQKNNLRFCKIILSWCNSCHAIEIV
jgi:hypothetical protein